MQSIDGRNGSVTNLCDAELSIKLVNGMKIMQHVADVNNILCGSLVKYKEHETPHSY